MSDREPPTEPSTEPLTDEERELRERLDLEPAPPRRSDAAFARAVAAGVEDRRRPAFLPAVAVAATCAAALFLVVEGAHEPPEAAPPADLLAATLSALDEPAEDELPLIDDELALAAHDDGWGAFATSDDESAEELDDFVYDEDPAEDTLALTASVDLPDDEDELRALSALLDDAIAARR